MIKHINVNLQLLEQMLFFWQASSENEKVAEDYLATLAASADLAPIYDAELDANGVRKVLSAITNRERMNAPTAREWKFWNNNMWVMEDMGILANMLRPIKQLNADALVARINATRDIHAENVEIIFIPGVNEEYFWQGHKLFINFFQVRADLYDENKVTIADQPILEYIEQRIMEMQL